MLTCNSTVVVKSHNADLMESLASKPGPVVVTVVARTIPSSKEWCAVDGRPVPTAKSGTLVAIKWHASELI